MPGTPDIEWESVITDVIPGTRQSRGLLSRRAASLNAQPAIIARTLRRIELFNQAGDDWRFAESLKSISEDTAQEYEGRAVLELVQNGHDALHRGQAGKITVLVDLSAEAGVLYVANEGSPFTEENFKSITEFALSNKGPGGGIGNKGLGFRSVLQLTDWPEVYSKADVSSRKFDGYSFRFATPEDLRTLLGDTELAARVVEQVSPLALPVPADPDDPILTELANAGFVTVVRVPLRNTLAASLARAQVKALESSEAPLLLFLDRVAAVTIEVRDGEGSPSVRVLSRSEARCDLVTAREDEWLTAVDLAGAGKYLVARRTLQPGELNDAIDRSIAAREIDSRWRNWSGETWVGIALRLDRELPHGQLYTFLPMAEDAHAPLCAHAHAPFFTKLARLDLSENVALNDYLLRQLATLAMDLARRLRTEMPHRIAAGLVLDLVCWNPARRINDAFDGQLRHETVVPLADGSSWGIFEQSYIWPEQSRPWSALTTAALAKIGVELIDPAVGPARQARAVELHRALIGRLMSPSPEVIASWAEQVAAQMRSTGHAGIQPAWSGFYDDLEQAFRAAPDAIRGKKLILDQDGELQPTLGEPAQPGKRERTVFFSPGDDGSDETGSRLPHDLRALQRRITFTHPQITWGRPGRGFLESNQLVREYRADRVFDAIRDLLTQTSSDALRRDSLTFAYRQFAVLNQAQRANLRRVGLFVPTADDAWVRATDCLLSPAWGAEGARRLERFLAEGGESVAPLADLRRRWIAPPEQWPTDLDDTSAYREFLRSIGVRDGLLLFNLGAQPSERNGVDLKPRVLAQQLHLVDDLALAWATDVEASWSGAAHPYTKYAFNPPLAHLPGAPSVAALSAPARRLFAELVILGLRSWGDHFFSVTVRRPGRPVNQQDPHTWPTPFSSYLRHMPWLPVEDAEADGPMFLTPEQTWFATEGELPAFIPTLPLSIRRLLAEKQSLAPLQKVGLRLWEDPRHSGELVKQLASILENRSLPDHLRVSFKKHYARAWADAARLAMWPWHGDEPTRLAVEYESTLTTITPSAKQEVYVCDEEAPLKESLVALAGHPVLITEPDAGATIAEILKANGIPVVRFSDTDVEVWAGEEQIVASADHPLLTDQSGESLVTVVALVLELKSGPFIRRSERGMRSLLDRLRAMRVVRVDQIEIKVGGVRAQPPATIRSLPLPDPHHPTVVVRQTNGFWDEIQACAPAMSQLLGQPSLQGALELAFVKLERILGEQSADQVDDGILAIALDTAAPRVTELRRSLTGVVSDLVRLLRPVLVYASGVANLEAIDEAVTHADSEDALREVIEIWSTALPHTASDLIATARRCRSIGDLRDALGLDFRTFNSALSALGSPYEPTIYPEAHEKAFDDFIREHTEALLDRLREHYSPLAARGDNVEGYTEARRLHGLAPDPAWLLAFRVPPRDEMRALIADWLRQHGADADLDRSSPLEPVDKLRDWNANRLDHMVPTLLPLITAWCRRHEAVVPPAWNGQPLLEAKVALDASGLSDLLRLPDQHLLRTVAASLGWPVGMPVTTNLDILGLTADDLHVPNVETAPAAGRGPDRTTIRLGNTTVAVGATQLADIADLAYRTVDEAFLTQAGDVQLLNLDQRGGQGRRGSPSTKTVVTRLPRMSEDQRTAVGLVGEVVARAWLLRRHKDVRWTSGYAAIINSDPDASDSHGYDFEIPWRNTSLLYEVKALTDSPHELTEFEMGESEVRAAQECANGNRYRILLVTSVLDPANRRLFQLPSPFSPKGHGRFRVTGRGLRYQFAPLQEG
ncbi:sacsin N-terminal ATP-binding-like domain-containing protein [Micromonospora chalcea]|uniref:sacsin N-terminal ATP-binding-like domain-containing protein n=1 Tax=Micromonospora chalcea TaxID=1874 RepID=UPI000CE33C0A|nr:hypothetical protein [Micromonospora chalcea]PPA60419.1 hypothetical protein BAW75_01295 [Micromonospora chalcea]